MAALYLKKARNGAPNKKNKPNPIHVAVPTLTGASVLFEKSPSSSLLDTIGDDVGDIDGGADGDNVGIDVGFKVGNDVGNDVGCFVGSGVLEVGDDVGIIEGEEEMEGTDDGDNVGIIEGGLELEGTIVGDKDLDGLLVGLGVGSYNVMVFSRTAPP